MTIETEPNRYATLDRGPMILGLRVVEGDFLPVPLVIMTKPAGEAPYPKDLTGYKFAASVSASLDEATLIDFDIDDSAANVGRLDLSLTANLTPGTYRWRLVCEAPGDVPGTAVAGALEVLRK